MEPYRSASHRGTDYSSDSGRSPSSRRTTDYSSDSGTSLHARHHRKSSDFELEIPSPDTSRSHPRSQHEDMFHSPTKSHLTASEYLRFSDSHPVLEEHVRNEHLSDYRHISRSEPNLDRYQNSGTRNGHSTDEEDSCSQPNNRFAKEQDRDTAQNDRDDEEDLRANFASPEMYHGDPDASLVQRGIKGLLERNKASDMTHWQQKQNNQANTDGTRVVSKSSWTTYQNEKPQKDYYNHHDLHHLDTEPALHRSSYLSPNHQETHDLSPRLTNSHSSHTHVEQLNEFRSAADAIIRDKDAIIDELKDRVVSLEEMVKEYENKLRRALMSRGANPEQAASFSKMQELEFRNAELRTELAKLKLQKDTEVEDLEIKLGGVEHEVVQLKAALRKAQPNAAEMKEKLLEKDEEVGEWKRKHSQLAKNYEGLKDKLEGMERYLADLPTLEEFTRNAEDLAKSNEDNELKKAHIADLEEKLGDTSQQLAERNSTILELESKQDQLAAKMRELTLEIKRIKSEGEGKALAQAQEELAETREVKNKVTADLEKAKKLLEMNHRRLRQLEAKHQSENRHLQERLTQEEESVIAFREEIRLKEEQISKLKKSVKDFANKNQDLMNESLILKEQLKQFEQTSLDETQRLQRRFVREMSMCFSELQTLVQICVQQAEGKDPNISLLLGSRASLDEEGAVGGFTDEESLKNWFAKLKELRAEVEKIRNMLCNKYAKEMGDNLNCATQ